MKLNLKNLTASLVIGVCAMTASYGMENFGLNEINLNVSPNIDQAKFTQQANRYLHIQNADVAGVNGNFSQMLNVITSPMLRGNFSTAVKLAVRNEISDKLLNEGTNLNDAINNYINGEIDENTPLFLNIKELEKQSLDRISAFANMPLLPQIMFNKDDVLHHIELLNGNIQNALTEMVTRGIEAAENADRTHARANTALEAFADREARIQRENAAIAVFENRLAIATNYVNNIHLIRQNINEANGNVGVNSLVDIYANCCAISLIVDNSIDAKNDRTIDAAFNAARSNLNEALTASFFGIVAHMNSHQGNADAAIRFFNSQFMTAFCDSFCVDAGLAFNNYENCQNKINSLINSSYRYLQHGYECDSCNAGAAHDEMIANDGIANIIRDSYQHITTFVVDHNSNIARDNMNGVANAANPINLNRNDALQQTLNIVNIKCAAVNPAQH